MATKTKGRKGSEEGVPENLGVPLEGDRDFGELCGSHQGCQVPFGPPIPNVGLLLRRCSGKWLHLAMTGEPRGFSFHWGNIYTKVIMIGGMEGKTCR